MTLFSRFKKRFYFVAAHYFKLFANISLKRWNPRIIAITGSVGKTTMLNLVELELGERAHYSHNANSAFGIAFDLVGTDGIRGSKLRWVYLFFAVPIRALFFKHTEEFYIVEIDGERPHETEFLAKWLKPEVTLWVSLGRSHAVQFDDQVESGEFENVDKAITHEFAMLPQYTQKVIYIDGDVPLMNKACEKVKKHHNIPAEIRKCYQSRLKEYKVYPDHTTFIISNDFLNEDGSVTEKAKKSINAKRLQTSFKFYRPMPKSVTIQLVMLENLCDYLDVPLKTDFRDMRVAPGRSSYFEGIKGIDIIDSSYNAHLLSVESVLGMVSEIKTKHKWLVLGDMVEQGSIEGEEHKKLALAIKKASPERVILIGHRLETYTLPELEKIYDVSERLSQSENSAEYKNKSASKPIIYHTLDQKDALKYIKKNIKGDEVVVFKGSQYLEWIIEKLLKHPKDAKRLCRREKAAVKRRERRGLN
ncbi:MAG: cyanophycin synthetase [Candidatus Saccharibacteria bacterium]|nr:cyanophycin synthetase [Candidatus Saccharibacteria bacterium]